MFLATFVLVSVDGEHDGLQEGIDFGHGDEATEMSDVTGFGLEEEEQVAIFLGFVVVGEETLLGVCRVVQMTGDFILLYHLMSISLYICCKSQGAYLFQRHAVLDQKSYPRIQITDIFFEDEILFGLGGDFCFQIAKITLSWVARSIADCAGATGFFPGRLTSRQII